MSNVFDLTALDNERLTDVHYHANKLALILEANRALVPSMVTTAIAQLVHIASADLQARGLKTPNAAQPSLFDSDGIPF
jgi:hypothetical protein